MTTEYWLPIPGYLGLYSASNFGSIRRDARGQGTWAGRILKPRTQRVGYQHVVLTGQDGPREWQVSRLVALAFHGVPSNETFEVNHLDGNKVNNLPENLEWITRSENLIHAYQVLGHKGRGGRPVGKLRTHCVHGHEYTPDNTRPQKDGSRKCRICANLKGRIRSVSGYNITPERRAYMKAYRDAHR